MALVVEGLEAGEGGGVIIRAGGERLAASAPLQKFLLRGSDAKTVIPKLAPHFAGKTAVPRRRADRGGIWRRHPSFVFPRDARGSGPGPGPQRAARRHALHLPARGPARARRPAPHALHFSRLSFGTGLAAVQVEEPLSRAPGPEAPFCCFGRARAARACVEINQFRARRRRDVVPVTSSARWRKPPSTRHPFTASRRWRKGSRRPEYSPG